MLSLLQLEWKKYASNRIFRIAMGMYILILPLMYMSVKSGTALQDNLFFIDPMYRFPGIWATMSYWASWLTFFLMVYLSVWGFTAEHQQKTLRQNLITGLSRQQFFGAKLLSMLSIAIFATVYVALLAAVFGGLAGGHGYFVDKEMYAILRFFVQTLFYMSFAFLLAVWLRKSGLAILLFYAYILIGERIFRYLVFQNFFDNLGAGSYFPASAAWDVLPMSIIKSMQDFGGKNVDIFLPYDIATGFTLAYTALFLAIAYWVFMRRDL